MAFGPVVELSSLNGRDGFQISGEALNAYSGASVSSAGDVNGDGFDDMIIGARGADPKGNSSGASYVVFGQAGGFPDDFELSNLDGRNGFQISGEFAYDFSGVSVSSAGDINGDGFDDVIIGASGADPNDDSSGASYVVFGQAEGFDANLNLSSLNGRNGFQITGEGRRSFSGVSVSSAGDINSDGFADVIIGAPGADPNGEDSGASYVVFGRAGGFDANLKLSNDDGRDGFQVNGEKAGDSSGRSVSSAGDVNGDGIDDLIIGAIRAEPNGHGSGASYVIFGQASGPVRRTGTAEDDRLEGGDFDDRLSGAGGDDRLQGEAGDDRLRGGSGDDQLQGNRGDDRLQGGFGSDVLSGGKGADKFVFRSATESPPDAPDTIDDFGAGDRIDLRGIDANPDRDGNQAFTFRDRAGFTGEGGEVAVRQSEGDTLVLADLDGDRRADLEIAIDGRVALDADDFLL